MKQYTKNPNLQLAAKLYQPVPIESQLSHIVDAGDTLVAAVKIRNRKVGTFSCRRSSKYFKTITALTRRDNQRRDRFPSSLLKAPFAFGCFSPKEMGGKQYAP